MLLAESDLRGFQSFGAGAAFSPQLLQQKSAQYQKILGFYQNAVGSGGGRWVLAGLHGQALLNKSFAQFFNQVSPPPGMSPQVFRKTMSAQADTYLKASQAQLAQCLSVADANSLPTSYSVACQKSTPVSEEKELVSWRQQSPRRSVASVDANLSNQLKTNPRSTPLLRQYAVQKIKNGEPALALLILSRAAEIEANDSRNESYSGVAHLHLNQYFEAQDSFRKALERNPNDPVAQRGLLGLGKNFGLAGLKQKYQNAGRVPADAPVHPFLQ